MVYNDTEDERRSHKRGATIRTNLYSLFSKSAFNILYHSERQCFHSPAPPQCLVLCLVPSTKQKSRQTTGWLFCKADPRPTCQTTRPRPPFSSWTICNDNVFDCFLTCTCTIDRDSLEEQYPWRAGPALPLLPRNTECRMRQWTGTWTDGQQSRRSVWEKYMLWTRMVSFRTVQPWILELQTSWGKRQINVPSSMIRSRSPIILWGSLIWSWVICQWHRFFCRAVSLANQAILYIFLCTLFSNIGTPTCRALVTPHQLARKIRPALNCC